VGGMDWRPNPEVVFESVRSMVVLSVSFFIDLFRFLIRFNVTNGSFEKITGVYFGAFKESSRARTKGRIHEQVGD